MAHWRQVTGVFDGCLSLGSTGLTNWSFLFKKEDLSKRSMYGQADLDLLKLRVLHHSKKSQERKKKGKKQGQQQVPLKKPAVMKKGINSQSTTSGISKVA